MINKLFNEDCICTLHAMENKSISGIITSPPYNINTERSDCYYNNGYSDLDALTEHDYISKRIVEFMEFSRVMLDDGVICYNISYAKENPILPILLLNKVHEMTDLTLADIISWKKPHAIPFQTSPTKLSRITELIYIIVKKDRLHTFSTNKEVSKINENTGQKFYKNYVNFVEAPNNDKYKCNHKATFSTELVEKLLFIYFNKDSVIYDPFIGIGTTALGCINYGCSYVGSEIIEEFHAIADKRTYIQKLKKELI